MTDIVERLRKRQMMQDVRGTGDRFNKQIAVPDALCQLAADEIERLRAERDALRAFARDVMDAWPNGNLDGDDLQPIAVKHGLLTSEIRTESCGDDCNCADYYDPDEWAEGITCYRKVEWLK